MIWYNENNIDMKTEIVTYAHIWACLCVVLVSIPAAHLKCS